MLREVEGETETQHVRDLLCSGAFDRVGHVRIIHHTQCEVVQHSRCVNRSDVFITAVRLTGVCHLNLRLFSNTVLAWCHQEVCGGRGGGGGGQVKICSSINNISS